MIAILPLLLSSVALAAPTGPAYETLTPRADSVDFDNQQAPNDVHQVNGWVISGYRGEQINYDVTQRCYIIEGKQDLSAVKVECIQSMRQVTSDIRRIGSIPTDCSTGTVSEKWTVSDSVTQTTKITVNTEVQWDPIKTSLGFEYSDQRTHTEGFERTVTCGDFKGKKCLVGGVALIEAKVRRGWIKSITSWDSSIPGTMLPQWDYFTDASNNYGMWDVEEATVLKYNPLYPTGWDIWNAKDGECNVGNNRFYDATVSS